MELTLGTKSEVAAPSRGMLVGSWALSGLVILFLLFDGTIKLMNLPMVREATAQLGYPVGTIPVMAVLVLSCTLLYAIPRTSVLGAVLLTGYLGGAVATHLRHSDPLFSHILFPVYVGIMAWGGLYLREPRLRALFPLRK